MCTTKEVDAVMLLKVGELKVAVTVMFQSPMSAFDCELTEKVFASGVATGVLMDNQLYEGLYV